MSTDDKRIREFAYQIWESEGKPVGQEKNAIGRWPANWPTLKPKPKRWHPASHRKLAAKSLGAKSAVGKPDGKLNAKGVEPKNQGQSQTLSFDSDPAWRKKRREKKPRAARKPPTT